HHVAGTRHPPGEALREALVVEARHVAIEGHHALLAAELDRPAGVGGHAPGLDPIAAPQLDRAGAQPRLRDQRVREVREDLLVGPSASAMADLRLELQYDARPRPVADSEAWRFETRTASRSCSGPALGWACAGRAFAGCAARCASESAGAWASWGSARASTAS